MSNWVDIDKVRDKFEDIAANLGDYIKLEHLLNNWDDYLKSELVDDIEYRSNYLNSKVNELEDELEDLGFDCVILEDDLYKCQEKLDETPSQEDLDFLWSLMPKWVKELPEKEDPEHGMVYGTLSREGDIDVHQRVIKLLKQK